MTKAPFNRHCLLIVVLAGFFFGGTSEAGVIDSFVGVTDGGGLAEHPTFAPSISEGFVSVGFQFVETTPGAALFRVKAPAGGPADPLFFLSFANEIGPALNQIDVRLGLLSDGGDFTEAPELSFALPLAVAGSDVALAAEVKTESLTSTHSRVTITNGGDWTGISLFFGLSLPDPPPGQPTYDAAIQVDTAATPEPSGLALFAVGAGLVLLRSRPVKKP